MNKLAYAVIGLSLLSACATVPPQPPAPQPAMADDRPLTLFERMMGMSRKPRAPEPAPSTLAPQPEPPQAGDDDVPGFLKRQVNR